MSNEKQPEGAGWNDSAHAIVGMNVAFDKAAVQFVGKHAMLLGTVAVTVPFAQLFTIVMQIMQILPSQYPAIALLAAQVENDAQLVAELRAKWGLEPVHALSSSGMHASSTDGDTRQLNLVD